MFRSLTVEALIVALLIILLAALVLEPRAVLGVVLLAFLAHRGRRMVRRDVKQQGEVPHD